jgi:hypothetical protein
MDPAPESYDLLTVLKNKAAPQELIAAIESGRMQQYDFEGFLELTADIKEFETILSAHVGLPVDNPIDKDFIKFLRCRAIASDFQQYRKVMKAQQLAAAAGVTVAQGAVESPGMVSSAQRRVLQLQHVRSAFSGAVPDAAYQPSFRLWERQERDAVQGILVSVHVRDIHSAESPAEEKPVFDSRRGVRGWLAGSPRETAEGRRSAGGGWLFPCECEPVERGLGTGEAGAGSRGFEVRVKPWEAAVDSEHGRKHR